MNHVTLIHYYITIRKKVIIRYIIFKTNVETPPTVVKSIIIYKYIFQLLEYTMFNI